MIVFYRIMVFNEFLFIKSKVDSAVTLSTGLCSFNGVDMSPSSAALSIPAVGADFAPVPGEADHAVIVYNNKLLMLTLSPSDKSSRKHSTFYTGRLSDFEFTSTGQMLGFRYRSGAARFSSIRHISSIAFPAVTGPGVF